MELAGIVTEIERYAIHDGSGIRTTVFLKGCTLRCRWCCNPETQEFWTEIGFFEEKCTSCGRCASVCNKIRMDENGHPVIGCGRLVKDCTNGNKCSKCLYGAIKQLGEMRTVSSVMDEVKRDISFYDLTGGGVTFSGGEPLCQPVFLAELLRKCKDLYIDTAIETCGAGSIKDYEEIMPYLDTVFVDLKSMDRGLFLEWAEFPLEILHENIIQITQFAQLTGTAVYLRIPMIPGFNDAVKQIEDMVKFILPLKVNGVEILPYHKLGRGKYKPICKEYQLYDLEVPTNESLKKFEKKLLENDIKLVRF